MLTYIELPPKHIRFNVFYGQMLVAYIFEYPKNPVAKIYGVFFKLSGIEEFYNSVEKCKEKCDGYLSEFLSNKSN